MTCRPGPCPRPADDHPAGASPSPGLWAIGIRPTPHAWFSVARRPIGLALSLLALTGVSLLVPATPGRAGIRFENCVQGSDGSISCDTVPTGNTYLDDKDAQYGLLQQASPGWSEFNPYEGYDEDFGGGDE